MYLKLRLNKKIIQQKSNKIQRKPFSKEKDTERGQMRDSFTPLKIAV